MKLLYMYRSRLHLVLFVFMPHQNPVVALLHRLVLVVQYFRGFFSKKRGKMSGLFWNGLMCSDQQCTRMVFIAEAVGFFGLPLIMCCSFDFLARAQPVGLPFEGCGSLMTS